MRRFRPKAAQPRYRSTEVDWGVALKEGHSDEDDPRAHEGIAQHAYLAADDRRAICGYAPPQQAMPDGTKRPALALPSDRYNPRCRNCNGLIWSAQDERNILAAQIGESEAAASPGPEEPPEAGQSPTSSDEDRPAARPPDPPESGPAATPQRRPSAPGSQRRRRR